MSAEGFRRNGMKIGPGHSPASIHWAAHPMLFPFIRTFTHHLNHGISCEAFHTLSNHHCGVYIRAPGNEFCSCQANSHPTLMHPSNSASNINQVFDEGMCFLWVTCSLTHSLTSWSTHGHGSDSQTWVTHTHKIIIKAHTKSVSLSHSFLDCNKAFVFRLWAQHASTAPESVFLN